MKKGDTLKHEDGNTYILAKDVADEIVCIEYAYQSCGGHIFPILKWVNIDETDLLDNYQPTT